MQNFIFLVFLDLIDVKFMLFLTKVIYQFIYIYRYIIVLLRGGYYEVTSKKEQFNGK